MYPGTYLLSPTPETERSTFAASPKLIKYFMDELSAPEKGIIERVMVHTVSLAPNPSVMPISIQGGKAL